MPKQQSSLDSFFGTGVKTKKQKTLTSFFAKGPTSSSGNDAAGEETEPVVEATTTSIAKKRRAIVDDSDDDDNVHNNEKRTDENEDSSMKTETIVSTEASSPAPNSSQSSNEFPDLPPVSAVDEKKSSPSVTPSPSSKSATPRTQKFQDLAKKLVKLARVSANDQLEPLASPVLYEDVVKIFEQIEAISGRLEIQAILTTFFRRLLKDAPNDLYHVVYLASNSIAPAYQCVELGIGDSILMKAIGEAYGTKASKCP